MAREKTNILERLQRGSLQERKQHDTLVKLAAQEYLNERFEKVSKGPQVSELYAETTEYHIDRQERLWIEYCQLVKLEPRSGLINCCPARAENFLHWMLKTYNITRVSSVETYWHQLNQLYIKWKGHRMEPLLLKKTYVFINGTLAKEHGLEATETDKPILEAEDLLEVLRCHWATDNNVFPTERQRVQLATLLLFAAFTGSRPGALLAIKYRDIDLFVLRNHKTGKSKLLMQLRLKKTKSRLKQKKPKTYTFNVDLNPMLCPISHITALGFDDDAFNADAVTSPEEVFKLGVKPGLQSQPIPWKPEKRNSPVFLAPNSPDKALPYAMYHRWLKRLGVETGFAQVLTTYCLRRGTGNAVNDDPTSNGAVRNLVMDHAANSTVFERNYLSRMIRYDTQAAYLGNSPETDFIRASNRMSRWMDPRRPKKLTNEQKGAIKYEQEMQDYYNCRNRLQDEIRDKFGPVAKAKGQQVYDDYIAVNRAICSKTRARERAILKQIQASYDATIPVRDIQEQLSGSAEFSKHVSCTLNAVNHAFVERSRIAEAFFCDKSAFASEDGHARRLDIINDLIALCALRERRASRTSLKPKRVPRSLEEQEYAPTKSKKRKLALELLEDLENAQRESKSCKLESGVCRPESTDGENFPVECKPFQCLFCIGNPCLSLDARLYEYQGKYSLKRHAQRCRLGLMEPDEIIACPHPHPTCAEVSLHGIKHFKQHATTVHGVDM